MYDQQARVRQHAVGVFVKTEVGSIKSGRKAPQALFLLWLERNELLPETLKNPLPSLFWGIRPT
jgi:hypothetical protein